MPEADCGQEPTVSSLLEGLIPQASGLAGGQRLEPLAATAAVAGPSRGSTGLDGQQRQVIELFCTVSVRILGLNQLLEQLRWCPFNRVALGHQLNDAVISEANANCTPSVRQSICKGQQQITGEEARVMHMECAAPKMQTAGPPSSRWLS